MFVTECLAYANLEANIIQQKQTLLLEIKDDNAADIRLVFNYLQTKVLAESLLAAAGQIQLKEFLGSDTGYLFGHLQVTVQSERDRQEKSDAKEVEVCPPSSLSAPTAARLLSKAV